MSLLAAIALLATAVAPAGAADRSAVDAPPLSFVEDLVFGFDHDLDDGLLGEVAGVAVDSRGVVHVLDGGFRCVHRFAPDGRYLGRYGAEGEGPGDFRMPRALAIGPDDRVYVGGHGSLVAVFDAEGSPLVSFKRDPATYAAHVTSIAVGPQGQVYVCAVDATRHKIAFLHAPDDFAVAAVFADSYAAGRNVDPRAERVFGQGYLAARRDGGLVYAQMTPPQVRFFAADGRLLDTVAIRGSDGRGPVIEIDGDRVTFHMPEQLAGQPVVLSDGRFLVSVSRPSRERKEGSRGFEGTVHVDLHDPAGRLLASARHDRLFLPRCADAGDRVYVHEARDFAAGEFAVVVRYSIE